MTPEKIIENSVHFINSNIEKLLMNLRAKNGDFKRFFWGAPAFLPRIRSKSSYNLQN